MAKGKHAPRGRGGRPLKTNVRRHANGRVVEKSDKEKAKEMKAVMLGARMRVHGLSPEAAKSHWAETALGRMALRAPLTPAQHEAGEWYREVRARHRLATDARRQVVSAADFERVRAHDGNDGTDESYVKRCAAATADYDQCRAALLRCGQPLAYFALESIILDNVEDWKLLGDLRCGLNALANLLARRRMGTRAA